ncbi:MAG: adenylosuccinate synthetase, partial [Micrococcales bacterium]|nr:adenylosuccinate synthetase [Micrococcales bacterium]
ATAAKNTLTVVSTERLLDELARGHTLFEGAQGYWLDECFGFQPHTTWSTTTPANARALARDAGITDVRTIGCLRTYATRHGAGPFPGEDTLTHRPPEAHNADTDTAGTFRTGAHDPALVRAAVDTAMPDVLAVSHLDMFARIQTTDGPVPVDAFGTVVVTATGPSRHDRHFAHTPR